MALNDTQKIRMHIVAGAMALAFVIALGRLYQVQCLDHKHYEKLADRQHYEKIPLPARRGRILDTRGTPLAICLPADSLYADPPEVNAKGKAAWQLAPVVGMEPSDVLLKLYHEGRFSWIKRTMPLEEAEAVRKLIREQKIKGIDFCREYRRGYPQGSLLGQTIGFVGTGDRYDPEGIKGVAGVKGLAGLELSLQQYLAGVPGYRVAQRDAIGTPIASPDLKEIPAVNGLDVSLTVDAVIQRIAEEEVLKAARDWRPASVQAVVMDPNTGDILALANWPSFDPNTFASLTQQELQKLSRNGAVLDTYEPGSTFKPFTMSGAIEENVISPSTTIDCSELGGRSLHDSHQNHVLTARQVIERSSNIGIAKIGIMCGPARVYKYITAFGFATRSGLPIPGEEPGSLAPVQRWSKYTISSVPMGQEVAVTAVQMAAGYSAIAAGGRLMKPRLLKKVTNPDTRVVVAEFPPEMVRQAVSPASARTVTEMLLGVVEDPHGTGQRAQIDGYRVAGKTGTAQKAVRGGYSSTDYVSSFVAFAPAYKPRVCVLVKVDTPRGHRHYGGTVAAPPVREIMRRTLAYLDIPPEAPYLARGHAPIADPAD